MLYLISLIPFLLLLIYDFKKMIHMAQQNLYNDDNRFLRWTIKDIKQFKNPFKCSLIVIITYIILILCKLDARFITMLYFALVSVIILVMKIRENKNNDVKIGLKITARVKRLFVTNFVLFMLVLLFTLYIKNINVRYLILFLYDVLINFIIMISIIINKPI